MLRCSENPPARYPPDRPLEADLGSWRVARVKSRQEKALAHDLMRLEIPYYLPLYEKRVRRRDNRKIRKTILPLFPGYLAFALPGSDRSAIYGTNRVTKIIEVAEQALFVKELAQIKQTLEAGVPVTLISRLQAGQKVRIREGPLQGLEGEVVRQRDVARFIIRVHLFRQAVALEIDEAYLEALG
ncbi:MAG: hypothetical protein N3A66_01835 [Planctomycetota bacterium]|nr:hypothetical protein [Planctomycetota bacterium]